jgi:hypothetical protein
MIETENLVNPTSYSETSHLVMLRQILDPLNHRQSERLRKRFRHMPQLNHPVFKQNLLPPRIPDRDNPLRSTNGFCHRPLPSAVQSFRVFHADSTRGVLVGGPCRSRVCSFCGGWTARGLDDRAFCGLVRLGDGYGEGQAAHAERLPHVAGCGGHFLLGGQTSDYASFLLPQTDGFLSFDSYGHIC